MDLRELRTFVALAEEGSLLEAGARLNFSPAAMHRRLKILGDELGVRLYEKHGGTLRLTPAGESLLPLARDVLLRVEYLETAARDWNGLKRGTVRLATGPTFCTYVLPPLLRLFRRKFPGIEVIVTAGHTGHLVEELNRGSLDLLFLVEEAIRVSDMVREAAWEFEIPLVAARGHGSDEPVRLSSLHKRPFILYRQGSIFEEIIDRYLGHHGLTPRVVMHLDNAEPIKAMIRSGFGISMLPEWTVRSELKRGTLCVIPQREPVLKSSIALLRKGGSLRTPAVMAFVDLARNWSWGSGIGRR